MRFAKKYLINKINILKKFYFITVAYFIRYAVVVAQNGNKVYHFKVNSSTFLSVGNEVYK
jgi:hypothetical protein